MSEVYGLLEEAGCGRGGRRGRVNVIAAGDRDGGGGRGCVRRPGRGQYAVDGEQRRADGRRLRDGRGPGSGQLSLAAVGVAAIARFSRQRRRLRRRRRRRQRAVAAFVVRGHRVGGRRARGRGRHRGHRRRSFRPATVVVAGTINAAVAPAEQSSVQFHPTHLPTVSPARSVRTTYTPTGPPAAGPIAVRRSSSCRGRRERSRRGAAFYTCRRALSNERRRYDGVARTRCARQRGVNGLNRQSRRQSVVKCQRSRVTYTITTVVRSRLGRCGAGVYVRHTDPSSASRAGCCARDWSTASRGAGVHPGRPSPESRGGVFGGARIIIGAVRHIYSPPFRARPPAYRPRPPLACR